LIKWPNKSDTPDKALRLCSVIFGVGLQNFVNATQHCHSFANRISWFVVFRIPFLASSLWPNERAARPVVPVAQKPAALCHFCPRICSKQDQHLPVRFAKVRMKWLEKIPATRAWKVNGSVSDDARISAWGWANFPPEASCYGFDQVFHGRLSDYSKCNPTNL